MEIIRQRSVSAKTILSYHQEKCPNHVELPVVSLTQHVNKRMPFNFLDVSQHTVPLCIIVSRDAIFTTTRNCCAAHTRKKKKEERIIWRVCQMKPFKNSK